MGEPPFANQECCTRIGPQSIQRSLQHDLLKLLYGLGEVTGRTFKPLGILQTFPNGVEDEPLYQSAGIDEVLYYPR